MNTKSRLLTAAVGLATVAAVTAGTVINANATTGPTTGPAGTAGATGPTGHAGRQPLGLTGPGGADLAGDCYITGNSDPFKTTLHTIAAVSSVGCDADVPVTFISLDASLILDLGFGQAVTAATKSSYVTGSFAEAIVETGCASGTWRAVNHVVLTFIDGSTLTRNFASPNAPSIIC